MSRDDTELHASELVRDFVPYYSTELGAAYHGDALEIMRRIPDGRINAIITSPPYALLKKKRYGNKPEHEYLEWFREFVPEFRRVLADDGSLVIEIGGSWLKGRPVRSLYQYRLLLTLVDDFEFVLAEEFFWFNKAKLPSPAAWVTVNRIRAKDAVTPIWWLAKTDRPKADNRNVLTPYSPAMRRLLQRRSYNLGKRPSGHKVGSGFLKDNQGAIPSNLIQVANTKSSDSYQDYCRKHGLEVHPARFPEAVPDFFVRMLTSPGDVVLDPFAGSNTTGWVAERHRRRWIAIELKEEYLEGSKARFGLCR